MPACAFGNALPGGETVSPDELKVVLEHFTREQQEHAREVMSAYRQRGERVQELTAQVEALRAENAALRAKVGGV